MQIKMIMLVQTDSFAAAMHVPCAALYLCFPHNLIDAITTPFVIGCCHGKVNAQTMQHCDSLHVCCAADDAI